VLELVLPNEKAECPLLVLVAEWVVNWMPELVLTTLTANCPLLVLGPGLVGS